VAAGAPLVEFEVAPFEAAKVGAERALEAAEKANARAQRLSDAGVLPRKDAEVAAADLAAAQANAVTARRARDLMILRAPFAGVVTRQSALLGASVDPSQPLVEVADPLAQDVLLTLSPGDAARVRVGAAVTLLANGGAGTVSTDELGQGRVREISSAVDSASGGVQVRVAVEKRTRTLRFGEAMTGRIAGGVHANALIVPAEALVPNGEGYRVFVVDSAGVAHAADVQVGGRSAAGVWIREGLKPGDKVVGAGAYGMDDLAKVVTVKP
jgi:RND family efflux transporter MFP subunit